MTRITVTSARGRVGGQVVKLLGGHDGVDVVGLTRALADYDDRPALTEALAGVDTLVLVTSDGEAERVLQHHLNVADAAAANGVGHVVALSSVDADLDSPFCYARVNALTERALADRGLAVTAVRASIYTEFFETLVDGAMVDGELRLPAEEARVSLVAREDVGRCLAACALLPPDAPYDVTGPAAAGHGRDRGGAWRGVCARQRGGVRVRGGAPGDAVVGLRLHEHVRVGPGAPLGSRD